MKLFSKNKSKDSDVKILLDIRSSSIGAAVISQEKNELPTIHYTNRKKVFFNKKQDSRVFISKMYKCLDEVLEDIVVNGLQKAKGKSKDIKIEEVLCVFASPWYHSKIQNFEKKEKKPITFTKGSLKKILQNKDVPGHKNHVLVDKKILAVYLNGYETEDPFGKKANQIVLSFYTSFISEKTRNDFRNKIREKLRSRKTSFSTHPLVTITTIRNIFHSLSNFLLIDVGGEITDLHLFKNSMLQSSITVPSGSHYFIRELISKCSLDKETAKSQLNLLAGGKLDKSCQEPAATIFANTKKDWLLNFKKVIDESWKTEAIPPMMFLTTDNESNDLMDAIFSSKESFVDTFKINREPILHIVNTNTVDALCSYEKEVKRDALISIIAGYSSL